MLFSTPLFLFLFFPLFLTCYFMSPRALKNLVLLGSSLLFYAWGEPRFVAVVIASALVDYLCGIGLTRMAGQVGRSKTVVALAVAQNLCLLLYFKYCNFFIESLNAAVASLGFSEIPLASIALPLGISFIVFEKITYVVDIYRGVGKPAKSFHLYLLYVFFFPKLLAGPIVKYHDIEGQLEGRTHSFGDLRDGLVRFAGGLGKKVLLADPLGNVADQIFGMSQGELGFQTAWLGILCFTLQIFFDFSGYSDMAIGMARMLGFRLMENFNAPYTAQNFTDFWRRWHISLSTWIREYLYLPLGGNRCGTVRTYSNLWICFLLSGLWHGAEWTFVAWGAYHGTFLVFDKLFWLKMQQALPRVINVAITFLLVAIGWVMFRAETFSQAWGYLATMAAGPSHAGQFFYVGNDIPVLIAAGLVIAFAPALLSTNVPTRANEPAPATDQSLPWFRRILAAHAPQLAASCLLLALSLAKASNATFSPFLYFRF